MTESLKLDLGPTPPPDYEVLERLILRGSIEGRGLNTGLQPMLAPDINNGGKLADISYHKICDALFLLDSSDRGISQFYHLIMANVSSPESELVPAFVLVALPVNKYRSLFRSKSRVDISFDKLITVHIITIQGDTVSFYYDYRSIVDPNKTMPKSTITSSGGISELTERFVPVTDPKTV
nr:hypothetical protein [Patescibacteria group bacterium]